MSQDMNLSVKCLQNQHSCSTVKSLQHQHSCSTVKSFKMSPVELRDDLSDTYISLKNEINKPIDKQYCSNISMVLDEQQQNLQNDYKLSNQNLSITKTADCHKSSNQESRNRVKRNRRLRTLALAILYLMCVGTTIVLWFVMNMVVKKEPLQSRSVIQVFHVNASRLGEDQKSGPLFFIPFQNTPSTEVKYYTDTGLFRVISPGMYEISSTLAFQSYNTSNSEIIFVCIKYSSNVEEFCKRFGVAGTSVNSFDISDTVNLKENDEFKVTINSLSNIYVSSKLNRILIKYTV